MTRAEIHVEFYDTFVPEVTRNRTVPESTRSDRQKCAYSCEGRVNFRSSSVDLLKTWSGKCRAVYIVWCQSCVEKEYVGRRGRQASRPKRFRQSFPAVCSSSESSSRCSLRSCQDRSVVSHCAQVSVSKSDECSLRNIES